MKQKFLTKRGYQKLQKELEERKKERRIIAQAIKEAKEQGDLSENAEYSEARHKQRINEARIMELESIIRTAQVVDNDISTQTVQIGCSVEVTSGKQKNIFHIVGASEADPSKGYISNESPIGLAMIGRKKGENISVNLPTGRKVEYKIISIKKQ